MAHSLFFLLGCVGVLDGWVGVGGLGWVGGWVDYLMASRERILWTAVGGGAACASRSGRGVDSVSSSPSSCWFSALP